MVFKPTNSSGKNRMNFEENNKSRKYVDAEFTENTPFFSRLTVLDFNAKKIIPTGLSYKQNSGTSCNDTHNHKKHNTKHQEHKNNNENFWSRLSPPARRASCFSIVTKPFDAPCQLRHENPLLSVHQNYDDIYLLKKKKTCQQQRQENYKLNRVLPLQMSKCNKQHHTLPSPVKSSPHKSKHSKKVFQSSNTLVLKIMDRQLEAIGFSFSLPFVKYQPEKSVFERWICLSVLGSGTFATVYKLKHARTGEIVAAKLLDPHRFGVPGQKRIIEMFAKEVKFLTDCQCPGVVKLKKVVRGFEGWLLIQELIQGGTLWTNYRSRDELQSFDLFLQLFQTVMSMQSKDIVHRDLKPTNILRTSDKKTLLVTDFGWSERCSNLNTDVHDIPGTIEINPPEVLKHLRCQSEKIDNYALAMNMMLLLSGRFVFRHKEETTASSVAGDLVIGGVRAVRTGPPLPGFNEDSWEVFLGLSNFNPEERYSLSEVLQTKWFTTMLPRYVYQLSDSEKVALFNVDQNSSEVQTLRLWHTPIRRFAAQLLANTQTNIPRFILAPDFGSLQQKNRPETTTQDAVNIPRDQSIYDEAFYLVKSKSYNFTPRSKQVDKPQSYYTALDQNSCTQNIGQNTYWSKTRNSDLFTTESIIVSSSSATRDLTTSSSHAVNSSSVSPALYENTLSILKDQILLSPKRDGEIDRYFVRKKNLVGSKSRDLSNQCCEHRQSEYRNCNNVCPFCNRHGRESATVSTTGSVESLTNNLIKENNLNLDRTNSEISARTTADPSIASRSPILQAMEKTSSKMNRAQQQNFENIKLPPNRFFQQEKNIVEIREHQTACKRA